MRRSKGQVKTNQDQADGAGVVNSFALCVGDWSSQRPSEIGRVTRATLEDRRFVLADGGETPSQLTPGAVEPLAKPRLSEASNCACTS